MFASMPKRRGSAAWLARGFKRVGGGRTTRQKWNAVCAIRVQEVNACFFTGATPPVLTLCPLC